MYTCILTFVKKGENNVQSARGGLFCNATGMREVGQLPLTEK